MRRMRRNEIFTANRRGVAMQEIVLATAVMMVFFCGMYFLSEKALSRLYHFVSIMVGSPL